VSLGDVGLEKRKGKVVKSAHVWLGPSETRFGARFACRFPRRRSNGNASGQSRLDYTSMDLISTYSYYHGARDEAVLTLMIQQVERYINQRSVANRSLFTPCILLRASTLSQHAETGKPGRGLTRRSKSRVLVPW